MESIASQLNQIDRLIVRRRTELARLIREREALIQTGSPFLINRPLPAIRKHRIPERTRCPLTDQLVSYVTAAIGITEDNFYALDRRGRSVAARNLVYLALRRRGLTYHEIGSVTGRDHTTVLHGVRRAELLREDPWYRLLSDELITLACIHRKETNVA